MLNSWICRKLIFSKDYGDSNNTESVLNKSKMLAKKRYQHSIDVIKATNAILKPNLSILNFESLNKSNPNGYEVLDHPIAEFPKTNRSVHWRFDTKRFSENNNGIVFFLFWIDTDAVLLWIRKPRNASVMKINNKKNKYINEFGIAKGMLNL